MLNSLYTKGEFLINGQKGTLNQLEGRLSFIDYIVHQSNIHDKTGAKHNTYNLSAKEKDYRNFLFYKHFISNKKLIIITEGKTDELYIKAALKKFHTLYPKLITKKGSKTYQYNISFLNRTKHFEYFFGTPKDGADAFTTLYKYFNGTDNADDLYKFFKQKSAAFTQNAIIFLFDNETISDRPLRKFISKYKLSKEQKDKLKKENIVLLNKDCNLNLATVPLVDDKKECEIEDLFDEDTLNTVINGRTFSRHDENSKKYYNKNIFSKYIYDNYSIINFDAFKPLLDNINKLQK